MLLALGVVAKLACFSSWGVWGLFSLGGVWGELVGGLRELLERVGVRCGERPTKFAVVKGVSVKRHCLRAGTGTLMQKRRTGDRRSLFATETAGRSMGKSFIW